MPANNIVSDGKKSLVGSSRTFDSRFFADSGDPLMGTGGRVAGKSRGPQRRRSALSAFEAARMDVFATVKQGAEEADFCLSGRKLIHARGLRQS